jgi:hypothetical protein
MQQNRRGGDSSDGVLVAALRVMAAVLVAASLSACATVVNGTTQRIPIASEPPAADVIVDGASVGVTPTAVKLKRNADHLVTIQKAGYEPKTVPIVKDIGGAVWGNVLVGGLIGWGVDAASGSQYSLAPSTVSVTLAPLSTSVAGMAPDDSVVFVSKLKALDQLHAARQVSDEEYLKGRVELFRHYMPEALPRESASGN